MSYEQNMHAAVAPGPSPTPSAKPQIPPRDMLTLIPEFNGDPKVLNLFLRQCEYVIREYQGPVECNTYLMHYVTSKLTGKAAALISERGVYETYDALRSVLVQHFGDPRSEECVSIELETLKIKTNESYLEFCGRVQDVRATLLCKVEQNPNNKPEMKMAKQIIYDNTALNVFMYNLPEHMVRLIRLKNPETLEDALKHVLEEVNFAEQYNARSKMLQIRPQTQNLNHTPQSYNNFRPLMPQAQFKFGIPGNQVLARPQFINQPMRPQIPNNNFGYRPPHQFGYKPNFASGPQQAQQFARPQPAYFRPQIQGPQTGFRPQVGQFGYKPPQFGFRPQAGQFGYRPPQPQGYRPPPFTNDVSMRTAPQKLPVNEMTTNSEGEYNPEYNYDDAEYYYPHEEYQPYDTTECYPETTETAENAYNNENEVSETENFCMTVSPKFPR